MTKSAPSPSLTAKSPSLVARQHPTLGGDSQWDSTAWDLDAQQPHGGQEWSGLTNFAEDFSVTTNFLGAPCAAALAASAALQHLHHYPAANFEPAISDLARFINPAEPNKVKPCLLLGNGASELIDLVTRVGAHQGAFYVKDDQYKEYERAALASGRAQLFEEDVALVAMVNPCNPTGEYLRVTEMKQKIEELTDHTTVLVDESMQLWHGPNWREDSLISQAEWRLRMKEERDILVYVIHSWTKIWSCPGLRLGSIIAPSAEEIMTLKKHQVPWSLNVSALAFLSSAVKDEDYLEQTWALTPQWRQRTCDELAKIFPEWMFHGEPWLSWIWIDTKDSATALRAVEVAKSAGVPIRYGGIGYGKPTFVRIAVRSPHKQKILMTALRNVKKRLGA
jgi:histidinol-phosphate/aromatic aminotransferase/cobyric acid decarboxylase-like protein